MGLLNFEDGFGTYFTQLIANGVSSEALMPTEGLKKNDAVVVLLGVRWLEGKCVLRDGDEIVGVVTGFTRRL